MIYGDSLSSLSSTLGGFPYSVQHMAGGGLVRVNRLEPRAPILCNTEHAHFVDVSKVDNGQCIVARCSIFHEGRGM